MEPISTGMTFGKAPAAALNASKEDAQLMEVARDLEASFLSEMLKTAGLGKPRESFGGGAGEDQFSSFLRQAQAQEMVKAGGIGLAQTLFEALKEHSVDAF